MEFIHCLLLDCFSVGVLVPVVCEVSIFRCAEKKKSAEYQLGFFLIQLKNGPRLRPLYQCRFLSKAAP